MKISIRLITFCFLIFAVPKLTWAEGILTYERLRTEVLKNNLDIKIQYENYYQSQRGVSVALGEVLPKLPSYEMLYLNTTYALLQSAVPTPTSWFQYRASKHLSVAQKYATKTIKLNILEGMTNNFINIKHHEAMLGIMGSQKELFQQAHRRAQFEEENGIGNAFNTFNAERRLLHHEQDIFQLKTLVAQEKELLMIGLGRRSSNQFILGDLPEIDTRQIPAGIKEAVELGIKNSTELATNRYQVAAASKMVSSQRWSFISFSGIGFAYPGLLSIEKSKARAIKLEGQQIRLKIENQIYTAFNEVKLIEERIELQKKVLDANETIQRQNEILYESNQITFVELMESKQNSFQEELALVTLHMKWRVKVNNIMRLLVLHNAEVAQPSVNQERPNLSLLDLSSLVRRSSFGGHIVELDITGRALDKSAIDRVIYTLKGFPGKKVIRNRNNDFKFSMKVKARGRVHASVRIILKSGKEIVKSSDLTLI